jgi:hypothetical protein
MRVRYNNSHVERERREREGEGNPKFGNDYWIWTHNPPFSLSRFLSDLSFPHKIKKTNFPLSATLLHNKKLWGKGLSHLLLLFVFFWEERTLAPAANALVFACMAKADIFQLE